MTPEIANVILQFLQRVWLQGGEVGAFMAATRALQDEANSATPPPMRVNGGMGRQPAAEE
jgi:hypothetical protein